MNKQNNWKEEISEILGLEENPYGEEHRLLIRDENGTILEELDYSDEVDEIADFIEKEIAIAKQQTLQEVEEKIENQISIFTEGTKMAPYQYNGTPKSAIDEKYIGAIRLYEMILSAIKQEEHE